MKTLYIRIVNYIYQWSKKKVRSLCDHNYIVKDYAFCTKCDKTYPKWELSKDD